MLSNTTLADFAVDQVGEGVSVLLGLALLPPYDGSGGVLSAVSSTNSIRRYDANGIFVSSYASNNDAVTAVALDTPGAFPFSCSLRNNMVW